MAEHDGCKGCAYVSRGENEAPCVKCTQNASDNYKRMTNADRIRSMSDEELAEFLIKIDGCIANAGEVDCSQSDECGICGEVIRNWLQSEVEE